MYRGYIGLLLIAFLLSLAAPAPRKAVAQEGKAVAAADQGHEVSTPHTKSRFMWFIQSSGLIGLVIFGLSLYFVASVVRLFIELRPVVAQPPEETSHYEQLIAEGNYQGIYDFARSSDSMLSRLMAAGVSELGSGLADAREVMDRQAEAETVDMERKISMLAVLGTLGPMIGLVGTLKGMIASFAVIALSDTQLKASEVAGGISEALLLTFEGVALSVPAIYFFAVFRNRVAKISVDTLLTADSFVRRIVQRAKAQRPMTTARA